MIKRIIDFFLFLKGISKTNRQDEVATKGLWAWKHYIGANQRQIKRERERARSAMYTVEEDEKEDHIILFMSTRSIWISSLQ